MGNRDEKWLIDQHHRLMTDWGRDQLIDWLVWNDPNGEYDDDQLMALGDDPLSKEDLVDLVMTTVEETLETPEELRSASHAANPFRKPY